MTAPRGPRAAPRLDEVIKRLGLCGWMDKPKRIKGKFFFLFIVTLVFILCIAARTRRTYGSVPRPQLAPDACPSRISERTITPLGDTKHFLVSAYMDQREAGFDVRIIGIFKIDSIRPLSCAFCCAGRLSSTAPGTILQHPDRFGFPYVTTDVMCRIPPKCSATHVRLLTEPGKGNQSNQTWLPIRNQKTKSKEDKFQFNFTVCVSNLFGDYNNVLQFAQTLEMYRLLGVNRVVIYNTSCGPDLDRLLQGYSREGFVEMVPWPIDQHLNPSRGWLFSESGGDVHYFGQLTTLNECVYRSMERSRYVLLNDIDEIIMPYRHDDLPALMDALQRQHPDTGVFLIENHIFPKTHFEPSGRFHLPQWDGVPGVNILEHIYREDPDRKVYHPHKMIVQPRSVVWTSVHEVLRNYGLHLKVPMDVCRIVHVRVALRRSLALEQLTEDKRLWDFQEKLIPGVDAALRRAGMLSEEGRS
ncbi:beta-1,4-galactosyltransferase galt-1-like [Clinocottus analis]|uniref:beta-1,4-galactosyltransferase galt-1-like n=1 Tax=Clinocottus analis TaxID=304258 RepID=UPI0035C26474